MAFLLNLSRIDDSSELIVRGDSRGLSLMSSSDWILLDIEQTNRLICALEEDKNG
jgi:hypothetical protein